MMSTVHCEWGEQGIEHTKDATDVFVIVDVLSFTTCVDVATGRGALVYPYRWMDMSSIEFAQKIGGIVGVSTRKTGFSLSPASLVDIPAGTRLVLPSPNGSTLSVLASEKPTLAGCLRNARAVARAAMRLGDRITVIAGGERWPDGSLRPAVEDWLGAGAVIAHLQAELAQKQNIARRRNWLPAATSRLCQTWTYCCAAASQDKRLSQKDG